MMLLPLPMMPARVITTISGFARSRSQIHSRRGTSEAMSMPSIVVTTLAVVMRRGGRHEEWWS